MYSVKANVNVRGTCKHYRICKHHMHTLYANTIELQNPNRTRYLLPLCDLVPYPTSWTCRYIIYSRATDRSRGW